MLLKCIQVTAKPYKKNRNEANVWINNVKRSDVCIWEHQFSWRNISIVLKTCRRFTISIVLKTCGKFSISNFFLSLKRKTLNQLSRNNPCKVSYFLRCLSITYIKKENLLFQSYTTLNRIYILKWHDNGIINLDGLIILWMFRISAKLLMNIWVTCIARA